MTTIQLKSEDPQIDPLFATPCFSFEIDNKYYLKDLTEKILELKKDGNGEQVTPFDWVSSDNLHTLDEFKPLVNFIYNEMKNLFDYIALDRKDHYISCMWSNVATQGHEHQTHSHPNSFYSGVLYLQSPEGAPRLSFVDPRPAAKVIRPDYNHEMTFNAAEYKMATDAGLCYFFPSWLEHYVGGGYEFNDERISISFNIMIDAEIKNRTMQWNIK
jgi:uncharacterized protein (TIGR02466 family)